MESSLSSVLMRLFLVLLLAGDFVHITAAQVVVNLCLVQTWFHFSARSGIGQAWTLVVEVAFYAFVPVWSTLIIAIDVLVIYALIAHGRERREPKHSRY